MKIDKGQIWNPFTKGYFEDPNAYLMGIRQEREVCHTINGHVLVLSHRLAKQVLRDPECKTIEVGQLLASLERNHLVKTDKDLSVLKDIVGKWLLFINPPLHTSTRRLMSGVFNRCDWTNIVKEVIDETMREVVNEVHVETVSAIAHTIPIKVMSRLMGLDEKVALTFRDGLYSIGRIIEPFITTHRLLEYDRSATSMLRNFQEVFKEKEVNPGTDFISELISEGKGELSMSHLVSLGLQMFFAGVETTIHSLSQIIHLLAADDNLLQEIKNDSTKIEGATEEMLRLASPLQYSIRTSTRDINLSGMQVEAGVMIYISLGMANRDPEVYADPNACILTRDASAHVAFGHGMHKCLGLRLAREEIGSLLHWMVDHDVDIKALVEPSWHNIIMMRGIESMHANIEAKA